MKPKKSLLTLIMLVLLCLLILIAGVLPLIGGTRVLGINPSQGGLAGRGQFPANGMALPEGNNYQPNPGDGNFPPGMDRGSLDENGNFAFNSSLATQMQTRMKLILLLQYGVGVSVLLFGILALVGLWLNRKWGKVLAVLTVGIVLAYSISSLFNARGGVSLVEGIVKLILALAVIVLLFLPRKKATTEISLENPSGR